MRQVEIYAEYATRFCLIVFVSLLTAVWTVSDLTGDDWKTGSSFRTALNKKLRIQSTGTLLDDLESLSRNTGVAIHLDREIDPSREVKFPDEPQPLGKILDDVATQLEGNALHVGSFVYVVPHEKAIRFLLLRNSLSFQISRLPDATRSKLEEVTPFGWKYLSNPRDTISVMAANCGLTVANADAIPHDLWPERNLPRLAIWEQLIFSMASMNRSFVIDEESNSIKIVNVLADQIVTLQFRKSDSRKIEKLLGEHQLDVQKVSRGSDFFVRGKLADCLVLMDGLQAPRKWNSQVKSGSTDVFDLNTDASRGSILATIARNRKVKLSFPPELAATLNEKITVNVRKATVEELLAETLKGTGLKYNLTESQLSISK